MQLGTIADNELREGIVDAMRGVAGAIAAIIRQLAGDTVDWGDAAHRLYSISNTFQVWGAKADNMRKMQVIAWYGAAVPTGGDC